MIQYSKIFLVLLSLLLLGFQVVGIFHKPDYRSRIGKNLLSFDEALEKMDRSHSQNGDSEKFLRDATLTYSHAVAYEWPENEGRVPITDNWILWALSYFDPVLNLFDIKKSDGGLFSKFETYEYKRALRRGFGVCSQNALGLSGLLYERYGFDARTVGLGGHVIVQVEYSNGSMLLDPSNGVILPFSLDYAETHLQEVGSYYQDTKYPYLSKAYNAELNHVSPVKGAGPYSAPDWKQMLVKYFEIFSDYAAFLLPLLGLLPFWRFFLNKVRKGN